MNPLLGIFVPGVLGLVVIAVSFVRWVFFPCNRYVSR
jgi:hypothetical protein